jgi:hypothetical protein
VSAGSRRRPEEIAFREIDNAYPALAYSPLVRAMEKTFPWIGEHGGVPLTPSNSFKRVFVHWAASEFDWPGHIAANLFAGNKVLNEPDSPRPRRRHHRGRRPRSAAAARTAVG